MRMLPWVSSLTATVAFPLGWVLSERATGLGATDTISALAAHPRGTTMVVVLYLVGLCHVVTSLWLPLRPRLVLMLGGVSTWVVAAAELNTPLHAPAAFIAFMALALWPAFTSWPRRLWLTGALLVAVSAFFITLGHPAGGVFERIAVTVQALATVSVAVAVRRPKP